MVTQICVSLGISGWFQHPIISTSACFYWFWHVVSWTHWHFPLCLTFLRQTLLHQHQFLSLLAEFSPLILAAGDGKVELPLPALINKSEGEKRGNPSSGESQSANISWERKHSSVCHVSSSQGLLTPPGFVTARRSWVCMDPPRAALRQSFGWEGQWELLFSRNLPQKMGGLKGGLQKPSQSWWWQWESCCAVTQVGVSFAVVVFWPWCCSWVDIYCCHWNLRLI